MQLLNPRFIRHKYAPDFFGMNVNLFNAEMRPYLTEIRIEKQGVAFDSIEMNVLADQYKSRNGRPPAKRRELWDVKVEHQASNYEAESGRLISESKGTDDWQKAVAQLTSGKRRST
jgi:hypothetical protein